MKKPFYKILYVQVLAAIAIGVILGHFEPKLAINMKPLGDGFIQLIKMVIGPIIFCTVVSGIAGMRDMKKVGRVGGKALLYFEVVSTFALVIGLVAGHIFNPGSGFNVDVNSIDAKAVAQYAAKAQSASTVEFLLNIIPSTIVDAFAKGDILQILLIALLFGSALSALGERAQMVTDFIDQIAKVLFRIVHVITRVAPIGAFGAMAFTIGKYGVVSLVPLLKLIGTFYLTAIIFVVVVLGIIARLTGFSIFRFVAYIKEELLIVLGTSSSESALPHLMEKMEKLGCSKSVVGLVVPTGYSFNLDGTNIYMTMAVIFISQALNIELTWTQQLTILAVAMLTSRGLGHHRCGLHHAGGDAGRGADHPGGGHGADPRHRPLHERVPCADQHHRQRRGLRGDLRLGTRAGPHQAGPRDGGRARRYRVGHPGSLIG